MFFTTNKLLKMNIDKLKKEDLLDLKNKIDAKLKHFDEIKKEIKKSK